MLRSLDSIGDIAANEWNALDLQGNPCVRHEFLLALEQTGCATRATGWQPMHLVLRDVGNALVGAAPLYLKTHSWGEFVFDFGWANAYARLGLEYFPKLVCAVPFTPATGPRLLISPNADATSTRHALLQAMRDLAVKQHLSSVHLLFANETDHAVALAHDFVARQDCQFHWHNRGYATFGDFIATLRADKRKKLLRERRRVIEAGIRFDVKHGHEMNDLDWELAFAMSVITFVRHGHEHYLNVEFFKAIAARMPESVVVIRALQNNEPVAVAICFRGSDTLYGRYWGAAADFHSLHFETCYLQGIEYCIAHGLQHFEPGTQGEHKVARGFEPVYTRSAHWIADARLRTAIGAHLEHEREAVARYADEVREHLPFHRGELP
jgi:predicted N-acyltransferase